MGRPPAPENTEQVTVRLGKSLTNKLRGTPKRIGGEIRDRLIESVENDGLHRATRDLVAAVRWIAEEIRQQTAPWPTNDKTQLALITGIRTWIEQVASQGVQGAVNDLFGPDDPATLGRSIARHYVRLTEANKQTSRQLKAAQDKREKGHGKKA